MNLFRSEEHARRWTQFNPASEEGFIELPDLCAFFGTETRRHWGDADSLTAWYPKGAAARKAILERLGKTSPFWLGTPAPA
jgi:hypothetical protein